MFLVGPQDIDMILDFLRIDKHKIDLHRLNVTFNEKGIEIAELVYEDIKTKKLNRCIIGINGVDKADVPITSPR